MVHFNNCVLNLFAFVMADVITRHSFVKCRTTLQTCETIFSFQLDGDDELFMLDMWTFV
jgi:hypothetical protein